MLDLLVAAGDGDDAVVTAGPAVFYVDGAPALVPDLTDARARLADDGASGVLRDRHLRPEDALITLTFLWK